MNNLLRREPACSQTWFIEVPQLPAPDKAMAWWWGGAQSTRRCVKSPFPSPASDLKNPVTDLNLKSFLTCASVHLLPSWPHLHAEGNGAIWMAWRDNEEYSCGLALPVRVPGQCWVPSVRMWGVGRGIAGRCRGMWRHQASDRTPSCKQTVLHPQALLELSPPPVQAGTCMP